jgi:hypothetical protein
MQTVLGKHDPEEASASVRSGGQHRERPGLVHVAVPDELARDRPSRASLPEPGVARGKIAAERVARTQQPLWIEAVNGGRTPRSAPAHQRGPDSHGPQIANVCASVEEELSVEP